MAKVHLTQTMIQKAEIRNARYTIRDDTPGLILRVGTSGSKVFYVDYYDARDKRCLHKLGSADVLTIAQARETTREFLARVTLGEDDKKPTAKLGEFLEEHYFPWVIVNRKNGSGTMRRIQIHFQFLWETNINNITPIEIERWRTGRIKEVKAATINKDISALKAAINWCVKRGVIDSHPLSRLERLQERDSQTKVRYLSPDENARLMAALDAREERLQQGLDNHNKWLEERGRPPMPEVTDHIRPMVIISLNTGIRRGDLFGLVCEDIDLERRNMTLRPEEGKPFKANQVPLNIPLNEKAFKAFSDWKSLTKEEGLVFSSPVTGKRFNNVDKSWASLMKSAEIKNFRWHDMRHDFASQLVMKGIDLNIVRELLGHSDMKMTLCYANLSPEAKAKAVAMLD